MADNQTGGLAKSKTLLMLQAQYREDRSSFKRIKAYQPLRADMETLKVSRKLRSIGSIEKPYYMQPDEEILTLS